MVQPEHRQREEYEDGAERPENPGVLERGLEIRTAQAGRDPGGSVGRGHREHVCEREPERTAGRQPMPLPDDDARQDGDHRQDAGREGEQQPEPEEGEEHQSGIAGRESPRQAILLGKVPRRLRPAKERISLDGRWCRRNR